MIKNFKKLKKLKCLKEKGESQMRSEGFASKELKQAIEKQKDKIAHKLNSLGWLLVLIFIFPMALERLGFSTNASISISWIGGGIIVLIIIPWLIDRYY